MPRRLNRSLVKLAIGENQTGLVIVAAVTRAAVGEEIEDLELARLEIVRGQRVTQPAHGLLTQQRQQEAVAGAEFLDDAASGSGRLLPMEGVVLATAD